MAELKRDRIKYDDKQYFIQWRISSAFTVLLAAAGFAKGALLVWDAGLRRKIHCSLQGKH